MGIRGRHGGVVGKQSVGIRDAMGGGKWKKLFNLQLELSCLQLG